MPDITVRGAGVQGLTPNIKLIDFFTHSVAANAVATEEGDHPGMYRLTVTDLPASDYFLLVVNGANVVGRWLVRTGTDDSVIYTGLEIPLHYDLSIDANISTPTVDIDTPTIVDGTKVTLKRGSTSNFSINGLGDLTGVQDIWFVGRKYSTSGLGKETIKISYTTGLMVAGSNAVEDTDSIETSDASITIANTLAGNLDIEIRAAAAALMETFKEGHWAIQIKDASGVVSEPIEGEFVVNRDIVRET